MTDPVVLEQLRKHGMIDKSYQELMPYEVMLRSPRILDKAPKAITLKHMDDAMPCGTMDKFVLIYNQLKDESSVEMATLDLRGMKKYCDASIYYVLQTLIRLSIGKSIDVCNAACDIFRTIITSSFDTITEGNLRKITMEYVPCNFYAEQMLQGIYVTVFHENEVALQWKVLCEFSGYYSEAIEEGMKVIKEQNVTSKELKAFCDTRYKEAKEDKEFMKNIYKPGANKYLIAMLWELREKFPGFVTQHSDVGAGFTEVSADE